MLNLWYSRAIFCDFSILWYKSGSVVFMNLCMNLARMGRGWVRKEGARGAPFRTSAPGRHNPVIRHWYEHKRTHINRTTWTEHQHPEAPGRQTIIAKSQKCNTKNPKIPFLTITQIAQPIDRWDLQNFPYIPLQNSDFHRRYPLLLTKTWPYGNPLCVAAVATCLDKNKRFLAHLFTALHLEQKARKSRLFYMSNPF